MARLPSLFRFAEGVIPAGERSATDLFVLVLELLRSGDTPVIVVSFTFKAGSLQQLVRMETE